jgi:hypothetical protein
MVLVVGVLAAGATLFAGLGSNAGFGPLIGAAAVLVYTAAAWATTMLGSLIARYIGLRGEQVNR